MVFEKRYVIAGVTLIDGISNEPQEKACIYIKDGVIEKIGSVQDYTAEDNLQVIDLEGMVALPGLIDAHVHLSGVRTSLEELELGGLLEPMLVRAMRSVSEAQKLLKWGFTSVRDISWNGLYLKRIFQEGSLMGPRIVACGPGLCRSGGHSDVYELPLDFVQDHHYWLTFCDGPEEIRKKVRYLIREGADQIKIWASGGDSYEIDRVCDVHYSFEELAMAVNEAKMILGTKVCAHCENVTSAKLAVKAGVDTIEHGEELDEDVIQEMLIKNIILVPTLKLLTDYYVYLSLVDAPDTPLRTKPFFNRTKAVSTEAYAVEFQNVIKNYNMAREAGVKIALGSDSVFEPVTIYGEYSIGELLTLVQYGMSPMEALRSATSVAAEALGLEQTIGSLEPGKKADFIIVQGNPGEDINVLSDQSNIKLVIKGGRAVVENGRLLG